MAATAASDLTDGPVLNLINKRLRALRKKHNRILQLEEAVSQGKPVLKEQEEVLRSKPGVCALIDELEKLRQPLSAAVTEEVNLAVQRHQLSLSPPPPPPAPPVSDDDKARASEDKDESDPVVVEDLLNLLYFGSLFDVKPQSDFTSTMLTRTHERGCCLTYDYVTDDATDLLSERDLDMISLVGGLLISRPVDSSLSHKNALQRCIQRAKLWLAKSEEPLESDSSVTYAGLRERLTKIMASDYFTTTPEMKAPVEVAAAAAAGNYAPFQVPVHGSMVPVQVEGSVEQYQQEDDDTANFQGHESGDNQSSSDEEIHKEELVMENSAEVVSAQQEQVKPEAELEQNQREVESKDQQYIPRRTYPNQRGGRGVGGGVGGRRGYSNGRGGRIGGRGGGSYQNGRNQYYDQPGNYYQRNHYNNWGRGGGRGGGHSKNSHGSAVQAAHASGDVGLGS